MSGRVILVEEMSKGLLVANPDTLFAFPDNLAEQGFTGVAGDCRRQPNAVSIPTMIDGTRHIFDDQIGMRVAPFTYSGPYGNLFIHKILRAFGRLLFHVRSGKNIVWPQDGMVTAENRLQVTAPTLLHGIEAAKNRVLLESNSNSHESPTS